MVISTPDITRRRDVVTRLVPFGWFGSLAIIVLLLAVSFFVAGYFVVYWRNADMDFMVVYSALSLNDGKYVFFPHPAYFTILSTSAWLRLLRGLGLIQTSMLSAVPSAADAPSFDRAMTEIVRAGRVLAGMIGVSFVIAFAYLARRLVADWRVAILGTFAFAFSGGVAVHLRILRSEMISGCLFAIALMILIVVARKATVWRPLATGIAASLCIFALENKIHAILLIAALPVLLLPFGGPKSASASFWHNQHGWIAVACAAIATVILIGLALPLIALGLKPLGDGIPQLRPLLFGHFGVYQAALLFWIVACMAIFSWLWRVAAAEMIASVLAVFAGAAFGLLTLYLAYDASNVIVVFNPVEEMLTFADSQAISATGTNSPFAAIGLLLSGVASVLQRYTFVLFTSPRPTVFLTWLIIPGIIYAWTRGEKQLALQTALLMLAAIGIDALGVRRGLKAEYFILTDPLIVIAGMLLLDRFSTVRYHKWAYAAGALLIALHIGISQAEPVKMLTKRSGPESVCEWNQFYLPRLPLPWCDLPRKNVK